MSNELLSRRRFLKSGIALGGAFGFANVMPANAGEWNEYSDQFANSLGDSIPAGPLRPDDEAGWKAIAKQYAVTSKITNLENAYWGIMSLPVLNEFKRLTDFINKENTFFARLQTSETYRGIRESVASFLNVGADEIALTRGATESLQILISGFNKLRPGDTVLYADLDYAEMKTAMRWLKERRGVKPVRIVFPEPSRTEPLTEERILAFYKKALSDNPQTKLLLLTHLNNLTGMIIPVAKIAKMAKDRGAAVILDSAHSTGQVDFKLRDLNCDFAGFNLHKWIGAPIGCGVIYINKSRIEDIDTFMLKAPGSTSIADRIDIGTANFAAQMAIPAAISYHNKIGTVAKEGRLRYLRNLWVAEARKMKGIAILAPDDDKMVAGLTSFRLDGVVSTAANDAVAKELKDKFGILTVRRTGPEAGDCIRVTPSVYNSPVDSMKLVKALQTITGSSGS